LPFPVSMPSIWTTMLTIEVNLLPPLAFPGGEARRLLELPEPAPVGRLLEVLHQAGALGGYDVSDLLVMVGDRVAARTDLLEAREMVRVLVLMTGG